MRVTVVRKAVPQGTAEQAHAREGVVREAAPQHTPQGTRSRRARPDLAREAVPHHTPQDTAEQARASGRGARGGTTAHMTARHSQPAVQQRLHHLTIFL